MKAPLRRSWHHPLHRPISLHPRLWLSLALMALAYALLPHCWPMLESTRVLLAWNVGAVVYIAACLHLMRGAQQADMRARAEHEDEGRFFVTFVVLASTASILLAVASQIATLKSLPAGTERTLPLLLAILTVLSSWAFTQFTFALHYAHDYYHARWLGQPGGLMFPDTEQPLYLDFLYFSCIIGTSAQTADININSRPMRLTVLLHCVQAFFFNTMILAIVINMAASAFS